MKEGPLAPSCAIFDIDGTLALRGERDPHDWQMAHEDRPNKPVLAVLRALSRDSISIVYVSGRPEESRGLTENWIRRHIGIAGHLYMRTSRDNRRDSVVKREIYETFIGPAYSVIAVFDDRNQVVEMWRNELGLTCFQVGEGDF